MPSKYTVEGNFVLENGVKKAEFDKEKRALVDFYNGGASDAAEIMQFIKDHKELGWKPDELSDGQIKSAKTIWDIIPEAPRPEPNTLGDKHPEVYDYVEKHYPYILKLRYPFGRYDKDLAGMGINLSPFRDTSTGRLSEQAVAKVKRTQNEKVEAAKRFIEQNS